MKRAEPRDVKLVADCHCDASSNSLIEETNDVPGTAAAVTSDPDVNDDCGVVPIIGKI